MGLTSRCAGLLAIFLIIKNEKQFSTLSLLNHGGAVTVTVTVLVELG